jgi:hypothetical protein
MIFCRMAVKNLLRLNVRMRSARLLHAGVAELADAQDLGSCGLKTVEVQILSPEQHFTENHLKPTKTRINIGYFALH